ncbi:protein of unknown function [Chitinophaga costaii]|uniref:DUF4382 domain-containing protein n=1 Tax=Chitinophaga costaii TaxID=1335309 RepID=A0A1C4CGM7_9BACT|nr:DUF4382 domain-containing protein [Chitinophaga costaii]PUZ27096.1 DUF4382 domain-containing protein [Chitinophaga costaii]SCC18261.1 protein of unknown function [Chitinophaga costaii]
MQLQLRAWPLALVALLLMGLCACNKNESAAGNAPDANHQKLNIYLSDDPAYFDAVNLDIRAVEVLVDTCTTDSSQLSNQPNRCGWDNGQWDHQHCTVWDTLAIRAGVYNLLDLRNGTDTLLGDGNVIKGDVTRIRITIGDNNSLVKDSVTYPLYTWSGQHKVIINLRRSDWENFSSGSYRLWLDFDVNHSVLEIFRGHFILNPFIRVFIPNQFGSISGNVGPDAAQPVISLYGATDTLYAIPWRGGDFSIRGVTEGTYSLYVNASNGYSDTTIANIAIKGGETTKLPKITLHK